MEKWLSAYKARADLKKYGDNSIGLFALQLRYDIDDIDSVATESITDGYDDKKCDLVHINKDDGIAVIAQCYESRRTKASAPANKASDLNTAVGWMLQRPLNDLPSRLRPLAEALRQGLQDGQISDIYIWYVHNLPESDNVKQELITVENTASSIIKMLFPNVRTSIQALEVGSTTLDSWYQDTLSPIIVNDKFKIQIDGGFEISSMGWKAFVTAIPARFLFTNFRKYRTRLFSANIRDYLGSRKSDANINFGIKQTAETAPRNFWVFNNGITVLTHQYTETVEGKKRFLHIEGMSIVNGAQTTGAIGSLKRAPDASVMVPTRFICTSDSEIIYDIIQFNNSQNKVTASDFRSRDNIQKRLREQISKIPDAEYQGGRRGGHIDSITRNPYLMPSYTVGQALASMHGDPVIAYNKKTEIWVSDKLYSRYFNEDTSGAHIIFAYSLLRAVEARKLNLVQKSRRSSSSLTAAEERQLSFFRQRGATYLLATAIACCLEAFLNRKVANLFRLSFGNSVSPKKAMAIWQPIVESSAAFCNQLEDAFTAGLKSTERVNKALDTFQSLIQATREANLARYQEFARQVKMQSK